MFGSLSFYFSFHYIESLSLVAWFALGLGILIISADVLVVLLQAERPLSQSLLLSWCFAAIALIFYLLHFFLEVPVDKLGGKAGSWIGKLQFSFLFLFILSYLASLLYRLLLTLNYRAIEVATVRLRKQKESYLIQATASILAVFLLVIVANYLTHLRNPSLDLSPGYFSFQENSRRVIKSIDREIVVHTFLPELQAVNLRYGGFTAPELYQIAGEVRLTLEQLPLINPKIKLEFYNADLEAYSSTEFGNVRNGTIVCRSLKPRQEKQDLDWDAKPYVERKVYINSEKDLDRLERDITKALVHVASEKKNIYFTDSNGERFGLTGPASRSLGIETFKEQLRFYNLYPKRLGQRQNWPATIPEDTAVLAIIGATTPFGARARQSILRYLKRGGAVWIAMDPRGEEDFGWLWKELGGEAYAFVKTSLTNTNLTGLLVSDNFEKHSITSTLQKLSSAMVVMPQQGYFDPMPSSTNKAKSSSQKKNTEDKRKKQNLQALNGAKQLQKNIQAKAGPVLTPLTELSPKPLLYSPYNSYIDSNGNGRRDSDEKTKRRLLGLAYEKTDMLDGPKLVLFAGTDWLSERGLRFPIAHSNSLLASDSMFWLVENPLTATLSAQTRPTQKCTAFR